MSNTNPNKECPHLTSEGIATMSSSNFKMSKDIFDDTMFRKLNADQKVLWFFLNSKCNLVGVFELDSDIWNLYCKPSKLYCDDDPLEFFGDKIRRIPNTNKAIIIGYIDEQHGSSFSKNSNQWKWVIKYLADIGLTYEHIQAWKEGREYDKPKEEPKVPKAKFIKPTLEELKEYVKEMGYHFNAESFIAFYESNGWMVGKNHMKSWKGACVTWENKYKYSRYNNKSTEANAIPVKNSDIEHRF